MAAVRIERTEKAANKEAVPVGGGRRNCRFVITCICLLSGTTNLFLVGLAWFRAFLLHFPVSETTPLLYLLHFLLL